MSSAKKNIFYAQSGGVTAVINATACGVIQAARENKKIGKVYAGRNGIMGGLTEELIDTTEETAEAINSLLYTPGGAFGSCRYKLKSPDTDLAEYVRLFEVFKAHDIGYFFYNGGNDSQDTTLKMSETSKKMGYPLVCIGIPKTMISLKLIPVLVLDRQPNTLPPLFVKGLMMWPLCHRVLRKFLLWKSWGVTMVGSPPPPA